MINRTITTIHPIEKAFPARLKGLPQPIEKLKFLGENPSNLCKSPVVGIVGSRKVSNYGRLVTASLAGDLAKNGVVIASGLALGVDSLAHRACLQVGGKTIAILPSGIANIYPSSHRGLAKHIVSSGGCLISEYEDNELPMKYFFIARNRIIAAICDVLLVTEAAEKSGSLYTAEFALEQGKTVFAVPGPINSPTSRGTNKLIQTGASVAIEASDILDVLGVKKDTKNPENSYRPENEMEKKIITLINKGVVDGSQILNESGLKTEIYQQQMTLLEIKGVISAVGNNTWRLR